MSWEDLEKKPSTEEKLYKEPIYRSTGIGHYYCIFRIGKRFKSMTNIRNFKRHMEREMQVLNADSSIKNEIIMGDANITENVSAYLEGVKMRKDSVYATELLLTASPGFFRGMPKSELDKWVGLNKTWLEKQFGENLRYAVLHLDESTPHIHALVVPVFQTEKGKILANKRYFGGREKLRQYQDIYAIEMQNSFKSLNRGIKFSKAKHIEIRHFYNMVNAELNEHDLESLCAKAKNGELLKIKLQAIQQTLQAYKDYSRKTDAEKQQLLENNKELKKSIKELKKDKEVFHEALDILSQQYKLPQNAIKSVLKYAENSLNKER